MMNGSKRAPGGLLTEKQIKKQYYIYLSFEYICSFGNDEIMKMYVNTT